MLPIVQTKKVSIAVLGAGSWGTALALVLARNGLEVRLWDKSQTLLAELAQERRNIKYLPDSSLHSNIVVSQHREEALFNVQDILVVVPSHAFCEALKGIKNFLTAQQRIVWATKGLEPGTGYFLHQVAQRELGGDRAYAVLSGPSFAKEVALGLPTAVTIASSEINVAKDIGLKFSQSGFGIYTSDDMIGVQLGGVVKNVLAVAVGLSDGLSLGSNARSALLTLGLSEMMRLGEALGARRETLMGLSGCGDAILTCTDNQSRNRRFGLALAQGLTEERALEQVGQVVEAVYNVEQLCGLAKAYKVELPIAELVLRVIKRESSPRDAVVGFFKRVPES